jgi:hypothetical protein
MNFLKENIITRFGVPAKITTDNAKAFSSTVLNEFCFNYVIFYHIPQIITLKELGWQNQATKTL